MISRCWRGIRWVLALPFLAVATVGMVVLVIGLLAVDRIFPRDNIFALFLQHCIGFNRAPVDVTARDVE
jgi:hypothetical protein